MCWQIQPAPALAVGAVPVAEIPIWQVIADRHNSLTVPHYASAQTLHDWMADYAVVVANYYSS